MSSMKAKESKTSPRMFQFPGVGKSGDAERPFSDQVLKKLLRKRKEELKLTKPLVFPLTALPESCESKEGSERLEIDTRNIFASLAFTNKFIEAKSNLEGGSTLNSISIFLKETNRPKDESDVDESV